MRFADARSDRCAASEAASRCPAGLPACARSATRCRGCAWPARIRFVTALDVDQRLEGGAQLGPQHAVIEEELQSILTIPDLLDIQQRLIDPLLDQAAAHGSDGPVQQPQQRTAPLAAQGLIELQVAARGRIQDHELAQVIGAQCLQQGGCIRLGGLDVLQEGAGGANRQRSPFETVAVQCCRPEVRQQGLLALPRLKAPCRPGRCVCAVVAPAGDCPSGCRISAGRSRLSSAAMLSAGNSVTANSPVVISA